MENNNTPVQSYNDEYEIDLREVFAALGRWKKTIIAVTVIAMLISGILSCFVMKPIYEAKVVLSDSAIKDLNLYDNEKYILKEEDDLRRIEDNAVDLYLPTLGANEYKELLQSSYVVNEVIKKLELDYSYAQMLSKIEIEQDKETNLLILKVHDNNPEQAARIAQAMSEQMVLFAKNRELKNIEQLFATMDEQLTVAEQDLVASMEELKNFRVKTSNGNGNPGTAISNEVEEKAILNEINRKEDAIDLLQTKILELKIRESFIQKKDRVIILSPANVPEAPIKPNKQLNIAIAGILGLMIAIFAVFFIEYMRKGKESTVED